MYAALVGIFQNISAGQTIDQFFPTCQLPINHGSESDGTQTRPWRPETTSLRYKRESSVAVAEHLR